jgi:trigger factor
MVKKHEIKELENSSVELKVTVDKKDVKNAYEALIAKYQKNAQIRGFRKGKAPRNVLEKKFGESILAETSMNIIDESLAKAFDVVEKKPLGYAQPELKEAPELVLDKDYSYSIFYDVYPEFTNGDLKAISVEMPNVSIQKEDIDRELESIREQNSIVIEKADKTVAEKDIVTIDYIELGVDDKELEETKREDFVFTVGSGYNRYKIDEDIIGMKQDESKVFEKTFEAENPDPELAGKTIKVKITIKQVKVKDLPELDDELAMDVSDKFNTLDELKKDIELTLEENLEFQLRDKTVGKILEELSKTTEIAVPKSMLQAELESQWRNFVNQTRLTEENVLKVLEAEGRTKETLFEEWKDSAQISLKNQLMLGKIQEEQKFEVSDEEVDAEFERIASKSDKEVKEIKDEYEKHGLLDYVKNDLINKKVHQFVISQASVKKGKKVKYLDFLSNAE